MKRFLAVALGVLTAIGGFVDIGDLITNAQVGAQYGLSLVWVTVIGVVGICVFAEMSGRIAAVSGRATFDLVRERLGPRAGLVNLLGSMGVTLLTFIAEIGGVALSIELIAGVNYLLVVPAVAVLVWAVLWRAKFSLIENVFGILGLSLGVFVVAVVSLGPDWSELGHQAITLTPPDGGHGVSWWYYVVALFGAAMTPYEVFFFSSGGVEERWTPKDLPVMRANVAIGFPLGGVLSVAIAAGTALVLAGGEVETLSQVAEPVRSSLGQLGVGFVLLGFVAATFGAACETGLSVGYSVAQYFGFQWGKFVRTDVAPRFHVLILLATILALAVLMTGIDPILVTEVSVVFSAVALPLTYFPILVVANDRDYMGHHVNGRLANTFGMFYLVILGIGAVAALPLMALSRLGTA